MKFVFYIPKITICLTGLHNVQRPLSLNKSQEKLPNTKTYKPQRATCEWSAIDVNFNPSVLQWMKEGLAAKDESSCESWDLIRIGEKHWITKLMQRAHD